jgi:hypothetical protein
LRAFLAKPSSLLRALGENQIMRLASRLSRPLSALAFAALLAACGGSDDGGGTGVDAGNGNGNGNGEPADSRITYVSELTLPSVSGGVPTCCKDFGELSKPKIEDDVDVFDNAFAQLASAVSLFGIDMQAAMTAQIEEGTLTILFEHVDLRSENDTFRLDGFFGAFAGATTYAQASAGQGSFTIEPNSYDGSGNPRIRFNGASMQNGSLRAGPAVVGAAFPVAGGALELQLHGAEMTGEATLFEGGVSYVNGTIAGYILLDDIFAAANDFLNSDACACLNLGGRDVFVKDGDDWDSECLTNEEQDAQTCEEDSGCLSLSRGVICAGLPAIIQNEADIRTDPASSAYQGLSVGWGFSGVPATIVD